MIKLCSILLVGGILNFGATAVQSQTAPTAADLQDDSWEGIVRRLEAAERTNRDLTHRLTLAENAVLTLSHRNITNSGDSDAVEPFQSLQPLGGVKPSLLVSEPSVTGGYDTHLQTMSAANVLQVGACGQCGGAAGCGDLCGEGCIRCGVAGGKSPWQKDDWSIVPFGTLTGEAIAAETVTTARPMILYLGSPIAGANQEQFTVHGQTTALGFNFSGPEVCGLKLGGTILFNFLGDRPALNQATPFFLRGYGELANEDWQFRFGQQGDLFNPLDPTTVNFGSHKQAGNGGAFRGSLRAARFIRPCNDVQCTVEAAISQQAVNDFIIDPRIVGTDNGLPNFEGRIALGIGPAMGARRAFEIGVSGVIGETRSIGLAQVVSDTWGVSIDASWSCERFGVNGEFLTGEAIGTYNAGIGQSLNPITLNAINTKAGWGEVWFKLTDRLTFHSGYGIDDPRDADLGQFLGPASGFVPVAGQRSRNEIYWTNLICAVSKNLDLGFEVSHRETDYIAPSISNEGLVYHFRTRIRF
ncbi:MAG: hypothetical protein ABGZ35_19490 [Planctomycetaceae bacterium]